MADELAARSEHVDPAAISLALGAAAANEKVAAQAAEFLAKQARLSEKQAELAELQSEELKSEVALHHWSLRFHHISSIMKLAFEIGVAAIVITIAAAIGVELWDAVHDNGLVVEAFQVPPDFAARGLSGQVVASQFLDKLTAMQKATISTRPAQSYANNWGNDVKVQIPDTGVSVGEFSRYLHAWLGNQTRIEGEVFHSGDGITVTARVGGAESVSFSGKEQELDGLLKKAAEQVYRYTQPYRYAVYRSKGLNPNATDADWKVSGEILTELTTNPSKEERAWAWLGLANMERLQDADMRAAARDFQKAIAEKPGFYVALLDSAEDELTFGHDEAALAQNRLAQSNFARLPQRQRPTLSEFIALEFTLTEELLTGDNAQLIRDARRGFDLPDVYGSQESLRDAAFTALAAEHDGKSAREAWRELPSVSASDAIDRVNRSEAALQMDVALEDWQKVAAEAPAIERAQITAFPKTDNNIVNATQFQPWYALAKAKLGDISGAETAINATPRDCYDCVRVRGTIAALARRWAGADYWFADAVKQAPSIPFAYTDWGAALLAKGDYDSAIAEFQHANQKGPHFADPLEMWGEALMRKNRSDLAVAKFVEANKYAPNWGRLHFKWGQALSYAGQKNDAKEQFLKASALDLSASDRAALIRWLGNES